MKTTFLLSKSLETDKFSHIISTHPVSIFSLPSFDHISGDKNPKLRDKAIEWFQHFENEKLPIPRLLPNGYTEAIENVRNNLENINIAELALRIGVREVDISRVLDGFQFEGKPYHFTFRTRVKFIYEVEKLLL